MVIGFLLSMRKGRLLAFAVAVCLSVTTPSLYVSPAKADQEPVRVLVLGDSLTAGYGLDDLSDAFPAQLERALLDKGYAVDIVPGGVSGDTTAGGRSRLDWSLADNPDAVIVELGGNDGLRAINPAVTYDNLAAILTRLEAEGVPVLLAGMLAPPNLGRDYGDRFAGVFERLSEEFDVVFYPFFLDGVAGDPALNQDDRIHPNTDGVKIIVERILPYVERLLSRVESASETAS